jgi:hypothetical protein
MALVLALPRLLTAVQGDSSLSTLSSCYAYPRLIAGWMSNACPPQGYDFPPWFWLKNTGVFWPLLLIALLSPLALKGRARVLVAAFNLVFLAANLVKFQPWDWDNSKLLVFWYMASAVAVGAMLTRIWRIPTLGGVVAAVAWVSLVASGVLSLLQYLPPQGPAFVWFSNEEVELATQVRALTPAQAIFVTGEEPNNPIADLAGRSVVISYPGWLWSYGINYIKREGDLGRIYQGGPPSLALLHQYHASYLVIGPSERASLNPNVSYFASSFHLVLQTPSYQIYQVP